MVTPINDPRLPDPDVIANRYRKVHRRFFSIHGVQEVSHAERWWVQCYVITDRYCDHRQWLN